MIQVQIFTCSIQENQLFSFNNPYLKTRVLQLDFTSFQNRKEVLAIIGDKIFNCLIDSVSKGYSDWWDISLLVLNEVYQLKE